MRWFSAESDEMDDAGWDRALADYAKHVAAIASRLPRDLARLATDTSIGLHDGHIEEIVVERGSREVLLVVARDDVHIILEFQDATIVSDDLQRLAYAVGAQFQSDHWGEATTQIFAQEIDISDNGRFVLRIRLWPFHQFAIEFGDVHLRTAPGEDKGNPGRLVLRE
ncbi:MAG: hypothetical protein WD830_00820 [Chloroflexota bacterium]